jgi:predicted nucleic acid-binding protein
VFAVVSEETDNCVLEAAVEGAADYIVSGDDHLLGLGTFGGVPIMRPGEFRFVVLTKEAEPA